MVLTAFLVSRTLAPASSYVGQRSTPARRAKGLLSAEDVLLQVLQRAGEHHLTQQQAWEACAAAVQLEDGTAKVSLLHPSAVVYEV
jgi:hypothetical protein